MAWMTRIAFEAEALNPAMEWIELHRKFWEESFDRLAEFLESQSDDDSPKNKTNKVTKKPTEKNE